MQVPMMIRRLKSLQEQNIKLTANRQLERPFLNIGCSPLRPTNSDSSLPQLADAHGLENADQKRPCTLLSSEVKLTDVVSSVLALSTKRLHSVMEDSLENNDKSEMPFPLTSSPKRFRINASDKSSTIENSKSNSNIVDNVEPVEKPQSDGFEAPKPEVIGKSGSTTVGSLNRSGSLTQLAGTTCRSTGVNRSGNSSPRAWIGRRENTS